MLRDIILILLIIIDLYFLALFKILKNSVDVNFVLIRKIIKQSEKKEAQK